MLEIRKNGNADPWKQYVYHPEYVDSIAIRYYDENTDGASIEEHYYLQDANFNVTAVADDTGAVVERYAYTPYGESTVLDADFSADADGKSDIDNEYLYTGRRLDPETGLQFNRNRFYHVSLGRWVNRDPIGYDGRSTSLYQYVDSSPLRYVDGDGLVPGVMIPGMGINPVVIPKPSSWGTTDFFAWYYEGKGKSVDLENIGLLDDFRKEINPEMDRFKKQLRRRLSTSCENPRKRIKGKKRVRYNAGDGRYLNPMTVMGGGRVTVSFECEERATCKICCPHNPPVLIRVRGRCKLKIEVNDAFSNPTDRGGAYNDDSQWAGATPYDITGNWTDAFSWFEEKGKCQ